MEGREASADATAGARSERWAELLKRLGFPDPVGMVRRDVEGGDPEVARALLFYRLWRDAIDPYQRRSRWIQDQIEEARRRPDGPFADAGLALARMTDAGVSADDIGSVARMAAYDAVFQVLYLVEFGCDPELAYDPEWKRWLPGWALAEMDPDSGQLTGRRIGGLHEGILMADPSGREGRPAPAAG